MILTQPLKSTFSSDLYYVLYKSGIPEKRQLNIPSMDFSGRKIIQPSCLTVLSCESTSRAERVPRGGSWVKGLDVRS